ncbi:MAG: hypothetical protein U5K55_05780 [Aliarcobacter sp.]|nr:hypothetical protein [Aliarcobacter sp.]
MDTITADASTKKYTFEVGISQKNVVLNDMELEKRLERAIHFLGVEILYSGATVSSTITELLNDNNNFIPYDSMYQDFRTASEIASDTVLNVDEIKLAKQAYFKTKIKEKLEKNETAIETRLYLLLKDVL